MISVRTFRYLDAYLKQGVIDKKAVASRIEWTRDRIDETLTNLKLLESRVAHWFDKANKP